MVETHDIIGIWSTPDGDKLQEALIAAQKELGTIGYDSINTHFHNKYTSYDKICSDMKPVLNKHGMALPSFRTGLVKPIESGIVVCMGSLVHAKSGQGMGTLLPLLNPKKDMQGLLSAQTYAQKAMLLGLCGAHTGDRDDDGNSTQAPSSSGKPSARDEESENDYIARATKAIESAADAKAAQVIVDKVELRVREGSYGKSVLSKVQKVFKTHWEKK
jgi:hypothetical protein|tara:strand:- start:3354 stop:4004 length:651 start_codon:yes stop_codon:yes gene_type:complete